MKIFVFSDNIKIFKAIYKILRHVNCDVDYFCSPKSQKIFRNINLIKPKNINSNYKDLLSYDIWFSLHSNQIFPDILINNILCINLHPGYNPYNKGIYPQSFSIINKLPVGATLHIIDSNIDSGPIIDQIKIKIEQFDTSLSLYKKNIKNILNHNFKTKQPAITGNYNSKKDFRALCKINLNKILSMQEAIDYFRALSHKPYNNAYFIDKNGNKIYISLQFSLMGGGCSNLNPPFASFQMVA